MLGLWGCLGSVELQQRLSGQRRPEPPPPFQLELPGRLAMPQINRLFGQQGKHRGSLSTEGQGVNGAERKTENLRAAGRSGGQQQQTERRVARLCPRRLGHPEPCLPSSLFPTLTYGQTAPHAPHSNRPSRAMPTYLRVQVADQKDRVASTRQPWDGNAASRCRRRCRRNGKGRQGSVDIRDREACKGRRYSSEPGWPYKDGEMRCCLAVACTRGHTHCLTPRPVQV